MKAVDDAVGFFEIERGIIEAGRKKNAIERFEGYAFRALVNEFLAQFAKKALLLGRERCEECVRGLRHFHARVMRECGGGEDEKGGEDGGGREFHDARLLVWEWMGKLAIQSVAAPRERAG